MQPETKRDPSYRKTASGRNIAPYQELANPDGAARKIIPPRALELMQRDCVVRHALVDGRLEVELDHAMTFEPNAALHKVWIAEYRSVLVLVEPS